MREAEDSDGGRVPEAIRRLDHAITDLEAVVAGLDRAEAGAPATAAEAAAEVARLKALHQAVAGRLDEAIDRLRLLVGE